MRPAQVVLAISPGARTKAAYERSYLAATRSLVSVFPDSRLILVSSTAVYGEQSGEEITDETPKHPQTETARVLSEAEDLALGLGHTVVRASGIYGPTRTRLLRRLCRGDVDESEADTWTNRIHRDDLSRVLSFLVTRPELRGSFIASDTEPAQLAAMMAWARGELGLEKINPRPAPLAAKEATRKSRRILPTRLLSLGFEFRYRSYREGYRELLAEVADSTEHD
jgi:nucleoside-diphosphate-sugar epimerase